MEFGIVLQIQCALLLTSRLILLWMRQIVEIYNRLISLDQSQTFVSAQHLTNKRMEFNKICISFVGIVLCQFAQIQNKVIALDLCQNFVSAQYLKNICTLMKFDKILRKHSY